MSDSPQAPAATVREFFFESPDGHRLAGRLFSSLSPKMAILVSSGTAYPQGFYDRFARFVAAKGAVVLTYDYRGIAGSNHGPLKGSPIEYTDWAKDQAAALDALKAKAPDLPVFHVGHSVGGNFIGFMPNQADIRRHAFVSVGSGHWMHHLRRYNPLELFFWFGFGPVHLIRHGYIKQGKLWSGTDLPPRVFRTWRRWCMKPDYFLGELKAGHLGPHQYDKVTAPIQSWLFTDDPIATAKSAPVLMSAYPNAPRTFVTRTPADYGRKAIGHDGAFRKGMEPLWQEIWDWFEQDLSTDAVTA